MGHVPIPPRPRNAHQVLARYERDLQRDIARGRCSRFGWRRRRAYSACLTLIEAREAALGKIPDPWVIRASARTG